MYNHTGDVGLGARNEEVAFHNHIVNDAATSSLLISDANEMFFFDGWTDEAALYNTALSEARGKAHYQAGITPVSPLVGGPLRSVSGWGLPERFKSNSKALFNQPTTVLVHGPMSPVAVRIL